MRQIALQERYFLQGKLVLQGNVKAVCKLGLFAALGFLHGVPESSAVLIFRRCMSWEKDFRTNHAAFVGVVADLTIVFAVKPFARTIGGRRNCRLSRTSLNLGNVKMEQG